MLFLSTAWRVAVISLEVWRRRGVGGTVFDRMVHVVEGRAVWATDPFDRLRMAAKIADVEGGKCDVHGMIATPAASAHTLRMLNEYRAQYDVVWSEVVV